MQEILVQHLRATYIHNLEKSNGSFVESIEGV